MKIIKKIILAGLVVLVILQFFGPEKNLTAGLHTEVFLLETNPPERVKQILVSSCYDCHSNHTNYPWYNSVAPISFWISKHIKDGKEQLNLSEWDAYSTKQKDHKLEEVIEMVQEDKMPLKEYRWTHEKAILSKTDQDAIIAWAKRIRALYQLNDLPE